MNQHQEPLASVRYCGRDFTAAELAAIGEIIAQKEQHPTRAAISRAVCRALNWRQANGRLKDVSCRVALNRMQDDGLVSLPPPRHPQPRRRRPELTTASAPQPRIEGTRADFPALQLRRVTAGSNSRLWNELIARYHYLGYQPLVGAQLRYLADDGDRLLAVLGFSAAAWRVAPRDEFIGWTEAQRQAQLHRVVNHSRFLILPWVRVRNLGSSLLSLAARQLPDDWSATYHYRPVLLETFVDERFRGTCYRAANWLELGQTTGRGKTQPRPRRRRHDAPIKTVFVYPLRRDFRQWLAVDPP